MLFVVVIYNSLALLIIRRKTGYMDSS